MKFSEKLGLILQGKTAEEIEALEAEEKKELENKEKEDAEHVRLTKALEESMKVVKDLEDKLQEKEDALKSKEDELTKLNADFANLNNKQTVKETPEKKPSAAEVFNQLYNKKKEEK